jgi:hypothetical protein
MLPPVQTRVCITMPNSQSHSSIPSLLPIERPRCPKCHSRMALARIVPGPKGYDLRNFECEKCDRVVTVTVATDPMRSDAAGWINGELGSKK